MCSEAKTDMFFRLPNAKKEKDVTNKLSIIFGLVKHEWIRNAIMYSHTHTHTKMYSLPKN